MAKNILIFSDGTGQIGGLRPDQRLSNVYKLYRAMRPGPDSPVKPSEQVAFYDPGLGAGEASGLTFRRTRAILSSAVGIGIDQNIIDCYCAIIANYEPGDRICLFGFSRGAYTVRSLANVLNLCGVPTKHKDGGPVPIYGPRLRKIAEDAVRHVYNHGAGSRRSRYEDQREKKAERFRARHGSEGTGADGEGQGNVQPCFIGVFDTVASLLSRSATLLALAGFSVLLALVVWLYYLTPWWIWGLAAMLPIAATYWGITLIGGQWKYFFDDPEREPKWWNPLDWIAVIWNGHMAWWTGKHYDRYVDREVSYLRHAISIDEDRKKFPRVSWGRHEDVEWNNLRGHHDWMKQVWFPGNHSDVGGSYPEEESRLSDISLKWMVDELRAAVPGIRIRKELLVMWPDPLGLQHDERQAVLDMQPRLLRKVTGNSLTWKRKVRDIDPDVELHSSVSERLKAEVVPQMGKMGRYHPEGLTTHTKAKKYFA